jgi:hypothetical protein
MSVLDAGPILAANLLGKSINVLTEVGRRSCASRSNRHVSLKSGYRDIEILVLDSGTGHLIGVLCFAIGTRAKPGPHLPRAPKSNQGLTGIAPNSSAGLPSYHVHGRY